MKHFVKKFFLFFVIGFIVLNILAQLVINSDYLNRVTHSNRVHKALNKSLKPIKSKVAILGDSVCHQIFGSALPYSFAINGAILATGNFILTKNILKNNKDIKYIVLLSSPIILRHRFNRWGTYGSFMKPFYNFNNLKDLSNDTYEKINNKPLSHFSILPIIKVSSAFPDINFAESKSKHLSKKILSKNTIIYIKKIKKLCEKNNVEFIIASTPVFHNRKAIFKDWKKMKEQVNKENLSKLFDWYFKSILYLKKNSFIDKIRIHLTRRYIKNNRKFLLKKILPKRVLLELDKNK